MALAARDHVVELHDHVLFCTGTAVRKRNWGQAHDCHGVVVRSNPILPLHTAAIAAVHQHLLAVHSEGNANGGHQRAAWALPVARTAQIDMPGGQAKWTMVPVLATGDRLPYEHAAFAAPKGLILVPAHFWPERRGHSKVTRPWAVVPGIIN